MKLEPLFTYHADLKPPVEVGTGPYGTRNIFEVTGGWFKGDKLNGKFLTGGADWLLIDANSIGHLDVRGTMETDDGAFIYMQYFGVLELNDIVGNALATGGSTEYGDSYFMTAPRLETGDPRYSWVNNIITVAKGRVQPGPSVEYEVYTVVND